MILTLQGISEPSGCVASARRASGQLLLYVDCLLIWSQHPQGVCRSWVSGEDLCFFLTIISVSTSCFIVRTQWLTISASDVHHHVWNECVYWKLLLVIDMGKNICWLWIGVFQQWEKMNMLTVKFCVCTMRKMYALIMTCYVLTQEKTYVSTVKCCREAVFDQECNDYEMPSAYDVPHMKRHHAARNPQSDTVKFLKRGIQCADSGLGRIRYHEVDKWRSLIHTKDANDWDTKHVTNSFCMQAMESKPYATCDWSQSFKRRP